MPTSPSTYRHFYANRMRGLRFMIAFSLVIACSGILVTATNWGHNGLNAGLGIALFVASLVLALLSFHRYLVFKQYTR